MNILSNHMVLGNSSREIAKEFLRRVLPLPMVGESYCGFVKRRSPSKPRQTFTTTPEDLVEILFEADENGDDAYFALATFRSDGAPRRTAQRAMRLRALYLDIDVGSTKAAVGAGYASLPEAGRAIKNFCEVTGLPAPVLVRSGHGVHVYWPLSDALPIAEWLPLASALKARCTQQEMRADPAVTADAARVLRLPGTTNYKPPEAMVEVDPKFQTIPTLGIAEARKILGVSQPTSGLDRSSPALERLKSKELSRALSGTSDAPKAYPTTSADAIANKCAQVARLRDERGCVSEPDWYAALGVLAFCEDGEEKAQEWSAGHPSYSREETAAKLRQARNRADGPTTCVRFKSLNAKGCARCRHAVKSPITLGRADDAGSDEDPNLAFMNERHFVLTLAGKVFIGEFGVDDLGLSGALMLSTEKDLKLRYRNRYVPKVNANGETRTVPLVDYWLAHLARREHSGIAVVPGAPRELPDGRLNLWSGWGVQPVPGRWPLLRRHILEVLADGDRLAEEYIVRYLAWAVQRPDERATVALVLQGGKGCGKGTLLNLMCRMFGRHARHVSDPHHLTGHFNAALLDCLLLFADEAFWAGDKRGEAVLKSLITEPHLTIERKGVDAFAAINRLTIVMASNSDWVVPATQGERRYAVFRCSDHYVRGNCADDDREAYFEQLNQEIDDGGGAAFLHDLLTMDLSGWHPRKVYETVALQQQKAASLSPYDRWFEDMLQEGRLPPMPAFQMRSADRLFIPTPSLTEAARAALSSMRIPVSNDSIGRYLGNWKTAGFRAGKSSDGRTRGWSFPPLPAARAAWERKFGAWDWRHTDISDWGE